MIPWRWYLTVVSWILRPYSLFSLTERHCQLILFFAREKGDWGSVGETVIPGCSLWFTLSTWENLMKARHLFRPDEIVSATDVLPGMQVNRERFFAPLELGTRCTGHTA